MNTWYRRFAISAFVAVMLVAAFATAYLTAQREAEHEWRAVTEPRTMDVRWGIVEELADCLDTTAGSCTAVPNFIPQSLWDNEACAALVRNTLNYTIGYDLFENAPAWTFAHVNDAHLTMVYDRSDDFSIAYEKQKVVEDRDDGFVLSELLSRDHLYVLGYHYHQTRSDPKIIEAKSFLNSHLMLLLPRQDSGWWGFHLVHFGNDPPIRIDRIDVMPEKFDLVYIWRVHDVWRPKQPADVLLEHNTLSYGAAMQWLRFGRWGGRFSSYIDTIMIHIANIVHDTWQFPIVRVVSNGDDRPQRILEPPAVITHVRVSRGDTLSRLVARHPSASVQTTLRCNPELHSRHRVYVSQVLRMCR